MKKARPDIEPLPQNANRWDSTWESLKNISLDKSIPDKIAIGKAKKDDKLYYYRNYSDIDVYRKLPKQKKVETDYDRERKECNKCRKQVGAVLKEMAVRRRDFVIAIIDGKIDALPAKETEAAKDKIWEVLLLNDTFINTYGGISGGGGFNKIHDCRFGSVCKNPISISGSSDGGYNLIYNNTMNICSGTGINVGGKYCVVSGNIILMASNGGGSINISGTNNLVTGNIMLRKNYINTGGETNTFINNKFIEEVT